ncbi:MAG: hypothetical protein ACYCOU_02550 [Sulfobacillus sp.]
MEIGQLAPYVKLRATDGSEFSSQDMVTKGPLVLAFFPLAFTPG